MNKIILCLGISFLMASCALTSNTIIKPNDSFVLGNNNHGSFKVKFKNVSKNAVEIHQEPNNGGQHSFQIVKPNEMVTTKIDKNTALIFSNKTNDTASIDLKVTGDIDLAMGYKN